VKPVSFLEWTRRRPFEPFRIVLSVGEVIEVRHPEAVMPTLNELVVGVTIDSEGIPARSRFVSYLHVDKIESIPNSAAPTNSNGAGG